MHLFKHGINVAVAWKATGHAFYLAPAFTPECRDKRRALGRSTRRELH